MEEVVILKGTFTRADNYCNTCTPGARSEDRKSKISCRLLIKLTSTERVTFHSGRSDRQLFFL